MISCMSMDKQAKSIFEKAAALPLEAPHILSVERLIDTHDPCHAAVIDIDEFETSLRLAKDPGSPMGRFIIEATKYRQRLIEDGRSA